MKNKGLEIIAEYKYREDYCSQIYINHDIGNKYEVRIIPIGGKIYYSDCKYDTFAEAEQALFNVNDLIKWERTR